MTTNTMNGDGNKDNIQPPEAAVATHSAEDSGEETREEKERRLYPRAPRREDVQKHRERFLAGRENRKDDLKDKPLEDLVDLAEKNPAAREALEEKLKEKEAVVFQRRARLLEALGVEPSEDMDLPQLMGTAAMLEHPQEVEPDVLAAAVETSRIDPSKAVAAIRAQDPKKADDVEKIFKEQGKEIKKLEDKPETPEEQLLREKMQTTGEELLEETKDFQKETRGMDLRDRSNRAIVEAKAEKIRTYLRDLGSHHFFESKQFKIAKGGTKMLFFVIIYLALMLFTMEMNLLIAIGKGGGK